MLYKQQKYSLPERDAKGNKMRITVRSNYSTCYQHAISMQAYYYILVTVNFLMFAQS